MMEILSDQLSYVNCFTPSSHAWNEIRRKIEWNIKIDYGSTLSADIHQALTNNSPAEESWTKEQVSAPCLYYTQRTSYSYLPLLARIHLTSCSKRSALSIHLAIDLETSNNWCYRSMHCSATLSGGFQLRCSLSRYLMLPRMLIFCVTSTLLSSHLLRFCWNTLASLMK